jgi:hypothetical protein
MVQRLSLLDFKGLENGFTTIKRSLWGEQTSVLPHSRGQKYVL